MTCPPKYAIDRKQLHLIRFRKDFAYQFLKIFFRFFPKGKARHGTALLPENRKLNTSIELPSFRGRVVRNGLVRPITKILHPTFLDSALNQVVVNSGSPPKRELPV